MSLFRRTKVKQGKNNARREDRDSKYKNRQSDEYNTEFCPKILRKPENRNQEKTESSEQNSLKEAENVKKFIPRKMLNSKLIIGNNHLDQTSLIDFIDPENSNFYVVGVIGMKSSGKSTLMNLLATGEIHRCEVNGKTAITAPLFSEFSRGNSIEAFITENRVILLDSTPILSNCRDFILSEADDLRQIQALFLLCHELLIIYEPEHIMNLIRMVTLAKNMLNQHEYIEPEITLIKNRTRPGSFKTPSTSSAMNKLFHHISDSVNIFELPEMNSRYTADAIEVIAQLRDDINIRKELKSLVDPSETEKSWWDKFNKIRMDGDHFIQRFEAIRDKYYQPTESDFHP